MMEMTVKATLQIVDSDSSLPLSPSPRRAEINRESEDEDQADREESDEGNGREEADERFDQEKVRKRGV